MKVYHSESYPKMGVSLYDAPSNSDLAIKIIAFNYLKCIEDDVPESPSLLSTHRSMKVSEWVLKGGHTPALESLNFGFNITGISKVVSHQLVRHRVGVSIGQRTQRANSKEYLGNFADGQHYSFPPSVQEFIDRKTDCFEIRECLQRIQKIYNRLIEAGVSQDEARYIIPQASETAMCFNVSYKSLIHICNQRLCYLMQGEMVEVVRLMKKAIHDYHSLLARHLVPICKRTGKCNRNENNPTKDHPKGVCRLTISDEIGLRDKDNIFDLTQYSKSAD